MSGATAEFDLQEQLARIKHTQTLIDLHVEETRKYISEARRLDAEQAKFNAEQAKLNRDRVLAPWLVIGGGIGGITTMVALILRAFNVIH
jgi:hypothetical protein